MTNATNETTDAQTKNYTTVLLEMVCRKKLLGGLNQFYKTNKVITRRFFLTFCCPISPFTSCILILLFLVITPAVSPPSINRKYKLRYVKIYPEGILYLGRTKLNASNHECMDSQHPIHAQGLIWVFALH